MSLVCLASAHGAPGVTTTTLALAGAWPGDRERLVFEADPFGGMLAARFGLADTPGLVSLAAVARRGVDSEVVWHHAQRLPGGVPVLVAPPSADQAHAVLRDVAAPVGEWAGSSGTVDVFADCGRLGSGIPHMDLLGAADVVWVVTRPTVDELRPAVDRLRGLDRAGITAELLLVGDSPYGPGEISSSFAVGVAGVVAVDREAAEALGGSATVSDLRRSRLVRSAFSLATTLTGTGQWTPPRLEVGS